MTLEDIKSASSKVVGTKQTLRAIEQQEVSSVYVALDADKNLIAPIVKKCQEKNIPVVKVEEMVALGKACDIKIGAAMAAILK